MIAEDGLQSFTMEALARTAGVSSPLVYNYFDSRQTLLQSLLIQEYEAFTSKLIADAAQAEDFSEVARIFITSNFDERAKGNVRSILESQPEIASAIRESSDKHGRQVARFLVKNTAENFKLTKTQAELVVQMSSGASIAAADYAALGRMNRKQAIETALAYVLAGIDRIASQDS